MHYLVIILLLLSVSVGSSSCDAYIPSEKLVHERRWNQREQLFLERPVALTQIRRYRDGGSLGFALTDRNGKTLTFCVDYRIGSNTIGSMFIGAMHATYDGAQKVPIGSQTEKALRLLLKSWVDDNFTEAKQSELLERNTVDGLTRMEFDAWTILRFLKNRFQMK